MSKKCRNKNAPHRFSRKGAMPAAQCAALAHKSSENIRVSGTIVKETSDFDRENTPEVKLLGMDQAMAVLKEIDELQVFEHNNRNRESRTG